MVKIVPTSIRAIVKEDAVFAYPSKLTVVGETEESVKDAVRKLIEVENLTSNDLITQGLEFYNECFKAIVNVSSAGNETLLYNVVTLIKKEGYQLVIEQSFLENDIKYWLNDDAKALLKQSDNDSLEHTLLVACIREVGIEYTCLCDEIKAHYKIYNVSEEVDCTLSVVA